MAQNTTTEDQSPSPSEGQELLDTKAQEQAEQEKDEECLREMRARLELAQEAESEIRRDALDDLEFRAGKQWDEGIEKDRRVEGRPCLVINRLPQFIQQITNELRQSNPSIKAHAVDDLSDPETAKIIQGLIRHIEYNSNAETAYDTAAEHAAGTGFGYFRITTAYVDEKSFDQDLFINRIRDQFSVYFDPFSQEPDGSDASFAFVVEDLSKDDFKSQYPDATLTGEGDWASIGNTSAGWVKADSVRVAEYFYKEMKEETLHLLSTGDAVLESELHAYMGSKLQEQLSQGLPLDQIEILKSRKTKIPVVQWIKTNGSEILEKTTWPGKYIPIIPVLGQELIVNGKRVLESVIRHAKDPQRMYNFWASAETEAIALAPRAPFIGAEGQFEGHEHKWATANRKNHAYLEYKPVTLNGEPAPPPQRSIADISTQAITQARMMSADDLKATTGIYDSAVGAQSNEVSGVAINARAGQSQTSNFHFGDNLKRSLKHAGRILIDLIPKIYDSARTQRIIGDDGTQSIVPLNQPHPTKKDDEGNPVVYRTDQGRYDVTVDVGPSFESKRQEAAASLLEFSRNVPQASQFCADLIAKNMDWPGSAEIAERLKKLLPPQLQEQPNGQQVPPQVQAQMQQMSHMIDTLTQHLNETTKIIETKKLDLEHKERIELWRIQAEAEMQLAKLGSQESVALLQEEMKSIKHRLELLNTDQPIQAPNDFNPEGADGGNYAGLGHVGGTENVTGGIQPQQSPGSSMEGTI